VPETTIKIFATKLQRPAEYFTIHRNFLCGFLARKSNGEPGWKTIWKGGVIFMRLVEGFELAQTSASPQ
jgi:hypothetical protein